MLDPITVQEVIDRLATIVRQTNKNPDRVITTIEFHVHIRDENTKELIRISEHRTK